MKKILSILMVLACCVFVLNLFAAEFTYSGAGKCKMCHKSEKQGEQFPKWEAGKHSKTLAALSSEKAAAVASEMGVSGTPADSPECLKCHGPLYEKAPELKAEGVSCEVCHGPGSDYKKMSVMKDHAEAVKNGMTEYGSEDAIKKQCLTAMRRMHGLTLCVSIALCQDGIWPVFLLYPFYLAGDYISSFIPRDSFELTDSSVLRVPLAFGVPINPL